MIMVVVTTTMAVPEMTKTLVQTMAAAAAVTLVEQFRRKSYVRSVRRPMHS